MASGDSSRLRIGGLAAIGCVAVAIVVAASGTLAGSDHRVSSIGRAPATTAVTTPAADPVPTPEVAAKPADPAPETSSDATSTDPASTATPPALVPTAALPAEVAQALTDMAAQLEAAGDDGRSPEMTREEVDAMVTAQLRALGIEL